MSQFKSGNAGNNHSAEEFNSVLNGIIDATAKVAEIIKQIENVENKNINVTIIENIDKIYKERFSLVDKLKSIYEQAENKEELIATNALLAKYNSEIAAIEERNLDFLKKKTIETKCKLSEISSNKSLLLYNPKVSLSYENKLI